MCDCLVCVKIADTKAGRKASQRTSIMCFLSLLFIEILLIKTKDYTPFLSYIIVVNILDSIYYCFLLLLTLSLLLLFPYHAFSIFSSVCFCKLHKPQTYRSTLPLQASHTIDPLHFKLCSYLQFSSH